MSYMWCMFVYACCACVTQGHVWHDVQWCVCFVLNSSKFNSVATYVRHTAEVES